MLGGRRACLATVHFPALILFFLASVVYSAMAREMHATMDYSAVQTDQYKDFTSFRKSYLPLYKREALRIVSSDTHSSLLVVNFCLLFSQSMSSTLPVENQHR